MIPTRLHWIIAPIVFLLQITIANGWFLIGQGFRSDEFATYLLVSDPSFTHSIRALADGVDFNVPGVYVQLRLWALLFGVGEAAFRSYMLLCTLLALVAVYALLRRGYGSMTCIAATLAAASTPVIAEEAFNARFYAPWLAATLWFAFFLSRPKITTGSLIGTAVTSLLVCSAHYFGFISLLLVVATHLLALGRPPLRLAAAAAVGPASLVFAIPLYLGQSAVLTVAWVRDRSLPEIWAFVEQVLPLAQVAIPAMVVCVLAMTGRTRPPTELSVEQRTSVLSSAGLVSFPLVLVVFSFVVQPAWVPRYAIVAAAAGAPFVAFFVDRMAPRLRLAMAVLFGLLGTLTMIGVTDDWRDGNHEKRELIADLQATPPEIPIVVQSVQDLAPLLHYAPELRGRAYLQDFTEEDVPEAGALRKHGRDLARNYGRWYEQFKLMSFDEVVQQPAVIMVPIGIQGTEFQGYFHEAVRLGGRVYFLERL